jgi:predicted permease
LQATLSGRRDREVREELDLHLQLIEEEYLAHGVSRDEARLRARREFGNVMRLHETSHDLFAFRFVEDIVQDLHYAVREIRRTPGFTCVAIGSLSVGIGVLVATFTIVDAFMLRGLPVHEPNRLVAMSTHESPNWDNWSYAAFDAWRESPDRLFDVAAASDVTPYDTRTPGSEKPHEVRVSLVSGNYFDVMRADVAVGRALGDADDSSRGTPPVAVISHAFWQGWFGGATDILTKTIDIQGRRYAIVGVAAKRFNGHAVAERTDVWIPLVRQPQLKTGGPDLLEGDRALQVRWLKVVGRLHDGIDIRRASLSADLIHQRFVARLTSELNRPDSSTARKQVISLLIATTGFAPERARYARPILILSGITALVFLVACANFSNLMIARATRRRREFAIRLALGGGRGRLLRQSMTECMVLAAIAGTIGLLMAWWATTAALKAFAVMVMPIELSLAIDGRVLAFAGGSVVIASAFGLLPNLRQLRSAVLSLVYQSTRADDSGRPRAIAGRIVVIAQIAMCAVLLIAAGLLFRTVTNLRSQDLGFDRNVLLVPLSPGPAGYPGDAATLLIERIRERLSAVPGILSVGVSGPALLDISNYWIDDSQGLSTDLGVVLPGTRWTLASVGRGFFKAVGIPVVQGRIVDNEDMRHSNDVIVINRSLATRLFGTENPLGRKIRLSPSSSSLSVVGVVGDATQTSPRDRGMGVIYQPMRNFGRVVLAVRTAGAPQDIGPVVVHQIGSIASDLSIDKVQTIAQVLDEAIAQERFLSGIAIALSTLVILVGCVGFYALMSHDVGLRTHELGVRLALGATSRSVAILILRDGLTFVLPALVLGIPLGIAASRPLSALLYGVNTADPGTLTSVVVLLIAITLLATIRPALAASRIDPIALVRNA